MRTYLKFLTSTLVSMFLMSDRTMAIPPLIS